MNQLAGARRLWQSVSMKTKNMRDMEKHWAEQTKKAAKPPKSPVRPKHEDANQAATPTVKETTEKT
jgi:hypothetical protein